MSTSDTTVNFFSDTADLVRGQALDSASVLGSSTSLVEYRSLGHCLIIGEPERALAIVDRLGSMQTTIACIDVDQAGADITKNLTASGVKVFSCRSLRVNGYLGRFDATVAQASALAGALAGAEKSLAELAVTESGFFDLVVDLSEQPLITASASPFGYYRVTDDVSLERCLDELPNLVGDFEKPKYFDFNAKICAHERSQIAGCNNCQQVCSTGAISSAVEVISIDPHLCQGCGHCASVCPTGAIHFAFPKPSDAIAKSRELIQAASSQTQVLLLYKEDGDQELDTVDEEAISDSPGDAAEAGFDKTLSQLLPDNVLALAVEEPGAFGIDYWSALIAGGIQKIVILDQGGDLPDSAVSVAMDLQHKVLEVILQGLGMPAGMLQRISLQYPDIAQGTDSDQYREFATAVEAAIQVSDGVPVLAQPANFQTHNNKRQTVRMAVDHLAEQLDASVDVVELPEGSPFGRLNINTDACTLCLACVSTCPAGALLDGQDVPQLRFIESNCVQCGLCASVCPESALSLQAQYVYDSTAARQPQVLHEETPFNCIVCHKPFATRKMIDNMAQKLAGHWMFEDESSRRRLKMCEDCRVKDMFKDSDSGITVHRDS